MKQNTLRDTCRHTQVGRLLRAALYCTLLLSAPGSGIAQNTTIPYGFSNDVKHYSTEIVPINVYGTNPEREAVMAGTIFNYVPFTTLPAYGTIHFLRYDGTGQIRISKQITDNRFYDLRAVDIAATDDGLNNYYYITALARRQPATTPPAPTDNDCILVLKLDDAGTVLGELVIENANTPSGAAGSSIYPLHSLINSDKDKLYICGYSTSETTVWPSEPDLTTAKNAFVLYIDIPAMTLNTATSFDYTSFGQRRDYDIAVRLTELSNKHIHVTGSVNAIQNWWPPYVFDRGASMNLVLNENTLGVVSDQPFMWKGQPEYYSSNEYGVALQEDVANGVYYLVGNLTAEDNPNYEPHDGLDQLQASNFFAAKLNASYTPQQFRTQNFNGNVWALQTLPSNNTTKHPSQTGPGAAFRLLVLGMAPVWNFIDCNTSSDFSTGNTDAFIMDLSVDWSSPGNEGASERFNLYVNDPGSASNTGDYFGLGGAMSSVYYNPTFGARKTTSDDVVMNAPKQLDGRLALKWIDPAFNNLKVNCGHESHCDLNAPITDWIYFSPVENIITNTATIVIQNTVTDNSDQTTDVDYDDPNGIACQWAGSTAYKTTGIDYPVKYGDGSRIYPNPASNHVFVAVGPTTPGYVNMKVVLKNILGQDMGVLYEGTGAKLAQKKLNLPIVPAGMYMIQIYTAGKLTSQQKLAIQ